MKAGQRITLLLLMVYSLEGTRCYGKKEFRHKIRVSKIAALRNKELFAPFILVLFK
jgi:hypothetical protein